jgi:spore coat polysaccharide biosynthesis predicted glycosyltransferase SpsG
MNNEIAFKSKENAINVMKTLLEENYVVLMSREENLYIINYEYSSNSDRNNVVFIDKYEFEEEYIRRDKNET